MQARLLEAVLSRSLHIYVVRIRYCASKPCSKCSILEQPPARFNSLPSSVKAAVSAPFLFTPNGFSNGPRFVQAAGSQATTWSHTRFAAREWHRDHNHSRQCCFRRAYGGLPRGTDIRENCDRSKFLVGRQYVAPVLTRNLR